MPLTATAHGPRTLAPYEAPVLEPVARVDPRDAARLEVEQMRKEGFEAGYEAGMDLAAAEVRAAIARHDAATERLSTAAAALEEAARDLRAADHVQLEEIERDVVGLAVALAAEIVGRELTVTDEPVRDALARAMQLVPDRRTPVAIVHPDDADAARDALAGDPRWRGGVDVVADSRVERGGCVLEVGDCRIDGQIAPALDRLRAALVD
jgi:flagellar assembly protein FliH